MSVQNNSITTLFKIKYPIIQAGMVWCSGWRLASAVSNEGGLGLIGAGSMSPEILRAHIRKCKEATSLPFGVNLPLLYSNIIELIKVIEEEEIKVVFTSAGNPATWTARLKDRGIKVVHVVSSVKFALKAEASNVDAVVAEGFEAGGHNGRDETTTFVLTPLVRQALRIPVIAAGGIVSGRTMLAAEVLGAAGFQIGSRFACSEESSAHQLFKERVIRSTEGDTMLVLKQLTPVRLLKNKFYKAVVAAENKGATVDELTSLLGRGRSRMGIFEGNLDEGELEIGQAALAIRKVQSVKEIMTELWDEYSSLKQGIAD